MAPQGTITAGVSTLDPYVHGFIGLQIADPLFVNIRQSAEVSNINEDPDRLYPGIDLKIRLLEETRIRPEIAVGLQSAIGHKRMSGEYMALSKRFHDFDFTAGMGWGRFGTAGHISNPLKSLSSHFEKNRNFNDERPAQPESWFTGKRAGFFFGMEYFTPLPGLSVKADWGADRFSGETELFDYDAPAPWSVGLAYSPAPWLNAAIAAQANDKLMARLSLKSNIVNWRDQGAKLEPKTPMRPYRTELALPSEMRRAAEREDIRLADAQIEAQKAKSSLVLRPGIPSPYQIGRGAVHMANHAGPLIEELVITPRVMGLTGPSLHLMRDDLERANAHNNGSSSEIWHNARLDKENKKAFHHPPRHDESTARDSRFHAAWKTEISLAEEDSGVLYRTALTGGYRSPRFFGLIDAGAALRLNLQDNLERLREIRPAASLPVRSDVDLFAARRLSLENSYLAFSHSFSPSLHLMLIGGYLEEMYAGLGGEILYRPFGSRFTLGAELWQAFKRDPLTDMNLGLNGDHLLSGHLSASYDIPHWDVTLKALAGRYLAEDIGTEFGLEKRFENGARLESFITVSEQQDFDLFGGTTHSYHGIRLTLPLGGFSPALQNATKIAAVKPFGRDIGQRINSPLPLYEVTEPFSYEHITRHWEQISHPNP